MDQVWLGVVGAIVPLGGTVLGGALVVLTLASPEVTQAQDAAEDIGWTGALALGTGVVCLVAVARGAREHPRRRRSPSPRGART